MAVGHPALTCCVVQDLAVAIEAVEAGTGCEPSGCVASHPGSWRNHMAQQPDEASTGDALAILADQFGQLAVKLADDADQPVTQQRLVEFAVRGVPGAEYASMTMVDGGRPPVTTAYSDELPLQWDQVQYEYGEGPCLDAIITNGVTVVRSTLR